MRLQEVYYICKKAQDNWNDLILIEKKTPGNITFFVLDNADKIRFDLSELEKIESFASCINSIRSTSLGFQQDAETITFDTRNRNILLEKYALLKNKVYTITELYESFNRDPNAIGFDVKLPPEISLSDLSKCTKDLNVIFSTCPLFSKETATIKFSSVDVGSVWLTFAICGAAVVGILSMIGTLVDKALIIRSHYLTTKEQKEKIRSLSIGNEALENLEKINKEISEKLLKQTSDELAKEYDINDPEDKMRLSNSIDLLSKWMSQGMEIYASVQSTKETKAVFPPIDTQALPESTLALFAEKNSEEE